MARKVLLYPYVTEKTMNYMTARPPGFQGQQDRVHRGPLRHQGGDKDAFEAHFEVKVDKVWTKISKEGKHAIIKLAEGYSAEDIGMRIGVF